MAMDSSISNIEIGQYIVIQRQKYIKLHKFGSPESTAMLGKAQIELRNIESHSYGSTFKMVPKSVKGKHLHSLEHCTNITEIKESLLVNIKKSGIDNRNVVDNGGSQSLTPQEIENLRDYCSSSGEIVNTIVENSKTFSAKTEYAQEKYLKKKEKKYFEYVQILQPTIRMISEIMFRQDPEKIAGLRMDSLSQLLSYSGICGVGNYLLYESGTNGLVPAALINSIGSMTSANLIHMHPGNVPQKQALLALNLEPEQLSRCISVNIYSVLRSFYQNDNLETDCNSKKRKADDNSDDVLEYVPTKMAKTSSNDLENARTFAVPSLIEQVPDTEDIEPCDETPPFRQKWKIENERACKLLTEKCDSLIVVAREDPITIVQELLPFMRPGRPIVVFSFNLELLMQLYIDLKSSYRIVNLRITSNWMRLYQILPNRTHPCMNMNGNSGFLLSGYTVHL